MAKKKRRSRKFTIPLAIVGGIAATPAVTYAIQHAMAGQLDWTVKSLGRLAGVIPETGAFDFGELIRNVGPIVAGIMVHKFVGGAPLNLNRYLANANVPVIRI